MNRRPSDVDARLSAWLEEGPTQRPGGGAVEDVRASALDTPGPGLAPSTHPAHEVPCR